MSDFRSGSVLGGYELEERLGGGSFGEVWRGHDPKTGNKVAVKLLTGMLSSPGTAAMRADVETLAAAAASESQHVVRVLGGGSDPVPYIVMEYVDGNDLSQQLEHEGRFSVEKTITVGIAISEALGALNKAGIVHRDIKPANVMMDTQGTIKLADFGIAKIVGYETMTMTGQAAMTMAYAAPEVWDDDSPFGRPSHRSDLYAMGILLYQCLAGETPFRGNYGALYRAHTERPPDIAALPAEVPPSLREVIRQCLEKKQQNRPETAEVCVGMLRRAEAELHERQDGKLPSEPLRFGPWLKLAPHETQPWAWRCRHDHSGEEATVELLFSDSLDDGTALRTAVGVSSRLTSYGAERLIESNRLLLRPGEAWLAPPAGLYQFWVAREDAPHTPAASVSLPALRDAVIRLSALMAAAAYEALPLALHAEDIVVQADGTIYARRPGIVPAGDVAAEALALLRGLPLEQAARDFIAGATSFEGLVAKTQPQDGTNDRTVMRSLADATVILGNETMMAPGATVMQPLASETVVVQQNTQERLAAAAAAGAVPAALMAGVALTLRRTSMSGSVGEYELLLRNTSAQPVALNLDAADTGRRLSYELPRNVMLQQNGSERLTVRVRSHKRRLLGGKRTLGFTVSASGGGAGEPPQTADGEFEDGANGMPLFIGGGVLGVGAIVAAAALMLGGGHKGHDEAKQASAAPPTATVVAVAPVNIVQPTATAVPQVAPAIIDPVPPVVVPPADPGPPPPPPNRMDCNAIRGTAYQSDAEEQWFRDNCINNTAPATTTNNATTGNGNTGASKPASGGTGGGAPPSTGGSTGGAGAGTGSAGAGTGGAVAGSGGNTGGGGGFVPPAAPPAPPAPVVKTPINIVSISCKSSLGTGSLSNVGPASSSNGSMRAASHDTISCSAQVTGDYTSLAWNGPGGGGSGASFSTTVGGPTPGNTPYDVSLTVNWNGNPAIAHIAITVDPGAASSGSGGCSVQGGSSLCVGH